MPGNSIQPSRRAKLRYEPLLPRMARRANGLQRGSHAWSGRLCPRDGMHDRLGLGLDLQPSELLRAIPLERSRLLWPDEDATRTCDRARSGDPDDRPFRDRYRRGAGMSSQGDGRCHRDDVGALSRRNAQRHSGPDFQAFCPRRRCWHPDHAAGCAAFRRRPDRAALGADGARDRDAEAAQDRAPEQRRSSAQFCPAGEHTDRLFDGEEGVTLLADLDDLVEDQPRPRSLVGPARRHPRRTQGPQWPSLRSAHAPPSRGCDHQHRRGAEETRCGGQGVPKRSSL